MNIGVVARGPGGLDGVVLLLLHQFLEPVEYLLSHQVALFHPAFHATLSVHADKTLLSLQHLDLFAVLYRSVLSEDLRNAVAQHDLGSGNISDLLGLAMSAASGQREDRQRYQQQVGT